MRVLGDMSPMAPVTNIGNCGSRNTVFAGYASTRHACGYLLTDGGNLFCRQLRSAVALARKSLRVSRPSLAKAYEAAIPFRMQSVTTAVASGGVAVDSDGGAFGMATFGYAILPVDLVIAKKQVSRIAARRVIAGMANQLLGGIDTVLDEVGHAMRWNMPKPCPTEISIGVVSRAANRPAAVRRANLNLIPEALNVSLGKWGQAFNWFHTNSIASCSGNVND